MVSGKMAREQRGIKQLETSAQRDKYWMQQALIHAREAARQGEIPVGAVLIGEDGLLASACNGPIQYHDPTAHAEILALRSGARRLGNYRLPGTTLYVTLEPCVMCMGALIHARVERLVYGATDLKTGAASSVYSIGNDTRLNHRIEVHGGILAGECGALLKSFFRAKRNEKRLGTHN